jgi:hypothetical protein
MTTEPMTTDSPENSAEVGIDVQRLVVPRSPVCGWQWVKCDDCGTTWKETSRDILSPSHVECLNHCDHGGDTHVWKTERADLPRDRSGNLLKYEREILTKSLGHNSPVLASEERGS